MGVDGANIIHAEWSKVDQILIQDFYIRYPDDFLYISTNPGFFFVDIDFEFRVLDIRLIYIRHVEV